MFFISSLACGCLWSSLFHCLLMLEANPPKAGESIGATPVVAAWQILTSGKCSIDVTNEVNLYASRSKSANVLCSVPWKIILSWHQWLPRCWVCLLVIAGQNLPKMPKWMPHTDASRMHGTALVHKCHVCFGQPLRLVHCRMLQDPRWRLAKQVPRVFLLCLVFPCVPTAWFFIKFWLFYRFLQRIRHFEFRLHKFRPSQRRQSRTSRTSRTSCARIQWPELPEPEFGIFRNTLHISSHFAILMSQEHPRSPQCMTSPVLRSIKSLEYIRLY